METVNYYRNGNLYDDFERFKGEFSEKTFKSLIITTPLVNNSQAKFELYYESLHRLGDYIREINRFGMRKGGPNACVVLELTLRLPRTSGRVAEGPTILEDTYVLSYFDKDDDPEIDRLISKIENLVKEKKNENRND